MGRVSDLGRHLAEIINVARTEAYAATAGAEEWFTPLYNNDYLRQLLGHAPYTTPELDVAPWYDPDIPESADFWGVYPTSQPSGIDDSSRQSMPVEFTTDGGVPGRLRNTMKTTVWSFMLMGATDKAVEYGMGWLRRALLGAVCTPLRADQTALGVPMQFLSVSPVLPVLVPGGYPVTGDTVFLYGGDAGGIPPDVPATPEAALREYVRFLYNSKVTNGPSVDTKHTVSGCTGAFWLGQFTALSGNPHQYHQPQDILQGYLNPTVTDPWAPDVPERGVADSSPHTWTEFDCGVRIWTPIYDPSCTAMITPPGPPTIPLGCYDPPASWNRWKVSIPSGNIALWGDAVPVLTVFSEFGLRNMRVRWYANPDGDFDPDDNPCDYVGDWVLSYIPLGGTMVVDSVFEQVRVTTSLGYVRRADSLVFQNDSTPITWPQLTCGYGWIMTIDLPADQPTPVIDLSLVTKAAA